MLNMAKVRVGKIAVQKPSKRSEFVGVRLRPEDVAVLRTLAKKAGLGISSYARLVLEEYARANRPKGKR